MAEAPLDSYCARSSAGLLDLVLLDANFFAATLPSFSSLLYFTAIYGCCYVTLCVANRWANGGHYPYPFMLALEWPSKYLPLGLGIFVVAVTGFSAAIIAILRSLVLSVRL